MGSDTLRLVVFPQLLLLFRVTNWRRQQVDPTSIHWKKIFTESG